MDDGGQAFPKPVYIRVSNNKVHETTEIFPDELFVDFDENGDVVGYEILNCLEVEMADTMIKQKKET